MAKELPYFKFEPNAWDSGNIQICNMETQGLFINLCALYWSRSGELPKKLADQKYKGYANALRTLCEEEIILVEDDHIRIYFLDEQLANFDDKSQKAKESADKRWLKHKQTKINANALRPDSEGNAIREEKKREEESIVEKRRLEESIQEEKVCVISDQEMECIDWLRDKFSLIELSQPHRDMKEFLLYLFKEGQGDHLIKQISFYFKYKEMANEKIHGLVKFIGEHPYQNGAWNECVWEKKYLELKENGRHNSKKGFNRDSFDMEALDSYINPKGSES